MRFSRPARINAAVVLLLAFCLVSGLQRTRSVRRSFRAENSSARAHRRPVESYLARIEPLKKLLPSERELGYIAGLERTLGRDDAGLPLGAPQRTQAIREFYLTQYALAPVLVVHDSTRPLLVANFGLREELVEFAESGGFEILLDAGNGIGLIRRKDG